MDFSQDYSYFFKKKLHMWADVMWALNLPITISIATKEVFHFSCLQECRTWAMYMHVYMLLLCIIEPAISSGTHSDSYRQSGEAVAYVAGRVKNYNVAPGS